MKLMKISKMALLMALSSMLVLALSACEDSAPDPVPSSDLGTEQSVEMPGNDSSNQFDASEINIISVAAPDIDLGEHWDENSEQIERTSDLLLDILMNYNDEIGQNVFGEGTSGTAVMHALNTQKWEEILIEDNGSFGRFEATAMMAEIIFRMNAEEEALAAIQNILIKSEAQAAFDQAVIQIVEDARTSHDSRNVSRLLDQSVNYPDQNEFVRFCAAFYIGFLRARGNDADAEIAREAEAHIEALYMSTR